ncbi:hypothetical protein SSS_09779 [Sarcoptes scabiei]|uniref:UBA domain-containing protein n=1 Tax=Sarcoptes scabiei TaxID=52283 RepID=A0A834RDL4_SARSC|nr:hypothetical protein SSS_09779 [Sarcoptes scabiei]
MMESKNHLIICNKINSWVRKDCRQLEIDNLNLTVEELSDQIATFFDLPRKSFEIVCFGKFLDSAKTLDFYGIENGSLLFLSKKVTDDNPKNISNVSDETESSSKSDNISIKNHTNWFVLKNALLQSSFRQNLENITDFEVRENLRILESELKNDPFLFGIFSDPDLLDNYASKENIKNVLKKYPNFLEIAMNITGNFYTESNTSGSANNIDGNLSSINYSLDDISDDDEMDEIESISTSMTNGANADNSLTQTNEQPASFSQILMHAYQNLQDQQQRQQQQQQQQQQNSQNLITADMLRQVLLTTSSTSNSTRNSQSPALNDSCQEQPNELRSDANTNQETIDSSQRTPQTNYRSPAQILIGWAPQLRQMHELGITDDIVAIQALEATDGDVQAAINLIFSDMS